jgi:2-polyprenyl-3-methyl-5-hydroxy-6-metoxy-1,4-benzoquinol methylase
MTETKILQGDTNEPMLIRTKWGFYQYHPLPDEAFLQKYYAERYYQEGLGSYEISYSDEEIAYYRLKNWLVYRSVERCEPEKGKFIDIGCGEGWLLKEFHENGYSVRGLDFSKAGIEKVHPHLLQYFSQGNLYEQLQFLLEGDEQFDIVALGNVIEHVRDPVNLLRKIRNIMNQDSILVITAPNDFSPLHHYLLDKKIVTEKWWLAYPDHLSYFNKESMHNLLTDQGFDLLKVVADNPVDLNLLNENSNYIKDRSKGKNTHLFRIRSDNFLGDLDREKLLDIYEIMGSMGVGRDLSYFSMLKK